MNEKLKMLIRLFWKGGLPTKIRHELLSELTDKESELRKDMEDEFGKIQDDAQLHDDKDYQLYLDKILARTGYNAIVARRTRPVWQKWAVAASLFFFVSLGCIVWWDLGNNSRRVNIINQQSSRDTTIIRNDGTRSNMFTLKDGSKVTLLPGSSIAFDESYGEEGRYLSLTGEAKFHVVRDTVHPFVVEASGYTTTALGTSFVVNARRVDRVNVKLLTGKVVVSSTAQTAYAIADQYLLPGEELAIHLDRLAVEKRAVVKETALVKRTPARPSTPRQEPQITNLHFAETPLPEVLHQISRMKQIQFDFHGVDMSKLYFTGDFSEKDNLETILDVISVVNGLEYEKQNNNTVKFRHAQTTEK